jgi:hypothetical protein
MFHPKFGARETTRCPTPCERGGEAGLARVSGFFSASWFAAFLGLARRLGFGGSCFGRSCFWGDGLGVGVSSTSTIGAGSRCAVLKSNVTTASTQKTLRKIGMLLRR